MSVRDAFSFGGISPLFIVIFIGIFNLLCVCVCVCVCLLFSEIQLLVFCWRNRPKEESMSVAVRTQRRDGVGVSFSLFLGVFPAVSRPPLRTCQLAAVVPFFSFLLCFLILFCLFIFPLGENVHMETHQKRRKK